MDTPNKEQIGTPFAQVEESPFSSFLNNLSPLERARPLRISQTFNSLPFTSPPSVFTSPHVSSYKEPRLLRRDNASDEYKPELPSDENKENTNKGFSVASHLCVDVTQKKSISVPSFPVEDDLTQFNEHPQVEVEVSQQSKYDSPIPKFDPVNYTSTTGSLMPETARMSIPYVKESCKQGPDVREVHPEQMIKKDTQKNVAGCDWEDLLSDATDLVIFDSAHEAEAFDKLATNLVPGNAMHIENPLDASLNECMASNQSAGLGSQSSSNLHNGVRRRCLQFESAGVRGKNLKSTKQLSKSLQPERKITNQHKLVAQKPVSDSSPCVLPVIDLHVNSLATPNDPKVVKNRDLASGGEEKLLSAKSSFESIVIPQGSTDKSLALAAKIPFNDGAQVSGDPSWASEHSTSKEYNELSPKQKKRKLENAGEIEYCKRCNCKRSKCLKLYCECFAAGIYCIESCSCQECFNKPIHEDIVLATRKPIESRNPLAFAPKVIRNSKVPLDIGDEPTTTPASARHKRGCNCKKSGCLKKYCECYQSGVGCSINCRCENCKNAFGRKTGSWIPGFSTYRTDAEAEDEKEADVIEKSLAHASLHRTLIYNNKSHNSSEIEKSDPLGISRVHVQHPSLSNSKPAQSSGHTTESSIRLRKMHGHEESSSLQVQDKLKHHFQALQDGDMPDVQKNNSSPSNAVKSSSPNSKRVSPPQSDLQYSADRRTGRKLILQSIPSFPSLTQL